MDSGAVLTSEGSVNVLVNLAAKACVFSLAGFKPGEPERRDGIEQSVPVCEHRCGDAGKGRVVCGSLHDSLCQCPLCVPGIHSQRCYWPNLQASEIFEDYFVVDWHSRRLQV